MSSHSKLLRSFGYKGLHQRTPVGQCIYCDSTKPPLTKEHIIPESLGGNITLPGASCDDCQKITRNIETVIAREVYEDIRAVTGMKVKQPPAHAKFVHGENPVSSAIERVPLDCAPRFLYLVVPEPPAIITGKSATDPHHLATYAYTIHDEPERIAARQRLGLTKGLWRKFDLTNYMRFMAKIAIGAAVLRWGLDGFDPTLIRRLIVGDDLNWRDLVGGARPEDVQLELAPQLGVLISLFVAYEITINGVMYGAVQIQIFCELDAPIYTVDVGQLTEAGMNKRHTGKQLFHA